MKPRLQAVLVIVSVFAVVVIATLTLITHEIAPRFLRHYERFPALMNTPKRTMDAKHHAADPLNVVLVGTRGEVEQGCRAANWVLADSLSRATKIAIAKSVLLNRPDSTAPVSPLYLFGRQQDLAFEQEVGHSARRRHHVRLWLLPNLTYDGRPVWLGDATFDLSAGMSHRGLHPTHHIAPDVDEERDTLEAVLARAGKVAATFRVTGVGIRVNAHNAEGDRFDTDGELRVIVLAPSGEKRPAPVDPGVPRLVALKDQLWAWAHHVRTATQRGS